MSIQPTAHLYSSAVTHLLQACSGPACMARVIQVEAAPQLTQLTSMFNTGALISRGHCLVKDPAVIEAVSQVEGNMFSCLLVSGISSMSCVKGRLFQLESASRMRICVPAS